MIQTSIHTSRRVLYLATFLLILLGAGASGRVAVTSPKEEAGRRAGEAIHAADPVILHTAHGRGNIQLAIVNNGTFGTFGQTISDPFTGEPIPSCEYPRNSDIVFLWVGAIWIGGIVGHDTVVSCGSEDFYATAEFWPELEELGGGFTYSSIDPNSKFYSPGVKAYSEEDIVCEYYDTLTSPRFVGRDEVDGRGHIPLGVKIHQRSMAWSYEYADDFILFNYEVENITQERLKHLYLGIWVDGDVWHTSRNGPIGWNDDIVGFLPTHPAPEGGDCVDSVLIAYHADNDGDPIPENAPSSWDNRSARGVVGTRVVQTPSDSLAYSFNWWIINYSDPSRDFGPRRAGSDSSRFRDFPGNRLGTPEGDKTRYYVMSHPEFDYDLYETAIDHSSEGWLSPPDDAEVYATGYDCRYLLSFGPFDLEPGQTLPITFAWVGGEDFHQEPRDFVDYFQPENPSRFYNRLNFDNLALNARWAGWVYDNPGVDTDNDGYYGKRRYCGSYETALSADSTEQDSLWYEGDGVPDFRGAGPPIAPYMRLIPSEGKIVVRWNGYLSETTTDVFTGLVDFEGYRVYVALDDRPGSFTLYSSYDRENFSRFVWFEDEDTPGDWIQDEEPYTIAQLREMFDDPEFDPLMYPRSNPYFYDSVYNYFQPQDYNQSDLTSLSGIHKVYPDATFPGTDSTQWQDEDLVFDYERPLPKYTEYEFVIDNLLSTIPYYVAVTTFDYGSPRSGLAALETNPLNNYIQEFPQLPSDSVVANGLDAYVYPNPYRIDADYAGSGFENREGTVDKERGRRIHFANLPPVCDIYIYSIDGDLIRRISHDFPGGGPMSQHETWDLITRNTQSVVSGLYYWVVESPERTQIGKLVIIR